MNAGLIIPGLIMIEPVPGLGLVYFY